MKTSDEFIEYVLELLADVGLVRVKRMFSGVLLTIEGQQLGIISNDILYIKVTKPDL